MIFSTKYLTVFFSAIVLLVLFSPRIAKAQDWEEKFVQYSSSGLDSDSGADVIDFDGDGILDVVMGSEQRKELQWLDNKGTSVTPRMIIDDFSGYFCVKTTDFNQDGFDDFVLGASEFNSHKLYLMMNDGEYNYELIEIGLTASTVDNMEVVDLDNDGDLDIVYDDRENNNFLRVWETLENNEFASHQVSFDGQPAYLFGVGDLDGNGTIDIMASHYDFDETDYAMMAVENHGDFSWTYHNMGFVESPETGLVGQFSGSDLPDLVQGPQDGFDIGVLWENQGNFVFDSSNGIPTGNYDRLYLAEDLDGNGFEDFFVNDFTTCRLVYSGGNSDFAVVPVDYQFNPPSAYVDYNMDGIRDFIACSGGSAVQFIEGAEDLIFTLDYQNYANGPDLLEVADMNQDGYNDIVSSYVKNGVFYLQQFDDVFAKPITFSVEDEANWISGSFTTFMPFDREGDGDLDILAYDSPNLMWLINENGEYIADLVTDDAGGWGAKVGDIDNDGFADAIVFQSPLKRYEASTNGYSTSTINSGGQFFDLGDYNGDGNGEVIYVEWNENDQIEIRTTTPIGGFNDELIAVLPGLTYTTNTIGNRTKMLVVDLDQNGFNDVLVCTGEEDLIMWIKQFENNETEVVVLNDDVWNPFDIEVADIDDNGETDVIIADRNNRRVVIMYNNGDGTFTNENLDAHIANPREVVIEDMNNDGDLDVVYSSARDNKIVVFDNKLIECDNSYLSLSETICASDSIEFNGEFISAPGLYTMTLENTLMCDSVVGLQLTNFESEYPVIEDLGTTLSIESNWSNVQWFLEGELIEGETLSSIDVVEYGNGFYTVSGVDDLGCAVLSDELFATPISVFESQFTFAMYPNPTSEKVKVELGNYSNVNIQIYSSTGNLVREWTNKTGTTELDLFGISKGMYEVVIFYGSAVSTSTLIKN